ncbi:unnamed protein product [Camellia sinensis]
MKFHFPTQNKTQPIQRLYKFWFGITLTKTHTHSFFSVEPTLISDPIPVATQSRRRCRSDDGDPLSMPLQILSTWQTRAVTLFSSTSPTNPFYSDPLPKPNPLLCPYSVCPYFANQRANNLREMYVVPNSLPNSMPQRLSTSRKRWNTLQIEAITAETVKQTNAEIELESEVITAETVKQTAAAGNCEENCEANLVNCEANFT